jgi:hypothetical protein
LHPCTYCSDIRTCVEVPATKHLRRSCLHPPCPLDIQPGPWQHRATRHAVCVGIGDVRETLPTLQARRHLKPPIPASRGDRWHYPRTPSTSDLTYTGRDIHTGHSHSLLGFMADFDSREIFCGTGHNWRPGCPSIHP